jgi:hypothetical protein
MYGGLYRAIVMSMHEGPYLANIMVMYGGSYIAILMGVYEGPTQSL